MSLTMAIFFMFRTLVEYRKNNMEFVSLLDDNIICITPFVNIDGYLFLERKYRRSKEFSLVRKNRNRAPDNDCPKYDYLFVLTTYIQGTNLVLTLTGTMTTLGVRMIRGALLINVSKRTEDRLLFRSQRPRLLRNLLRSTWII